MAISACFSLSCAAFISTAANSVPPALTAELTADCVTAYCSVGGLPAQPTRTRLLPSASAASLSPRRWVDEVFAVRVFMVVNSIGSLLMNNEFRNSPSARPVSFGDCSHPVLRGFCRDGYWL
ncbi:hypothetical protein D3C80_1775680 [compost metagenome]